MAEKYEKVDGKQTLSILSVSEISLELELKAHLISCCRWWLSINEANLKSQSRALLTQESLAFILRGSHIEALTFRQLVTDECNMTSIAVIRVI